MLPAIVNGGNSRVEVGNIFSETQIFAFLHSLGLVLPVIREYWAAAYSLEQALGRTCSNFLCWPVAEVANTRRKPSLEKAGYFERPVTDSTGSSPFRPNAVICN